MSSFYLEPIETRNLPEGVVLKAFLKTCGDTLGVIYLDDLGGVATWRNGSCLGTYDNIRKAGFALERRERNELKTSRARAAIAAATR